MDGTENAHTERRKIIGLFEFTSKASRRFFACKREGDAIFSVTKSIQENYVAGKESGMKYVLNDLALHFQNHDTATSVQERINLNEFATRPVNLHTLDYGSVCIGVVDITCGKCKRIIRYDGEREGIFSASKSDVCTRKLLDT